MKDGNVISGFSKSPIVSVAVIKLEVKNKPLVSICTCARKISSCFNDLFFWLIQSLLCHTKVHTFYQIIRERKIEFIY